jgi:hypothetical protein
LLLFITRCRSCAKLGRKLDQLAHQYDEQRDQKSHTQHGRGTSSSSLLKIGTVEYMAGRDICRALNIEALPTIHLYHHDNDGTMQKVQDFTCPPSAFDQLQSYCKYYVDRAQHRLLQQQNVSPDVDVADDEEQQDERRFVEALDRGHAMMESSLQDTKKAGKLRSGWKRLWLRTGDRLRRVVNVPSHQD